MVNILELLRKGVKMWQESKITKKYCPNIGHGIINRPGVAGAVLQSPLLLIYWFINWLIL